MKLPFLRNKDKAATPTQHQPQATGTRNNTLWMLTRRPPRWPLSIVLPLKNKLTHDMGFVFLYNHLDVVHGFVFAASEDVLRSYNGDVESDIFYRWIAEQRVTSYGSYQELLDAGWEVD